MAGILTSMIAAALVGCTGAGGAVTPRDGDDAGGPSLGFVDSGPGRGDAGRSADAGAGGDLPDDAGPAIDAGDPVRPPPPVGRGACFEAPPPMGERADPLPSYSGGACPTLSPGDNRIRSGGADRSFILVVPDGYDPATEALPLAVLWPWLGGDAHGFLERGEVQDGANRKRFIAAIMDEKGDLLDKWPWSTISSSGRIEEELTFFDDVLACVAEQLRVNPDCVSSVGVSAGALWTAQLAARRSTRLSSVLSLSGGVGGLALPFSGARHAMPALVLWGGAGDWCGVDFQVASRELERGLDAGGHFVLECVHDCGHSVPPFNPPTSEPTFAPLWDFVLEHPYWLAPGESPFRAAGLPVGMPSWCAIGSGSAVPRADGMCSGSGCF